MKYYIISMALLASLPAFATDSEGANNSISFAKDNTLVIGQNNRGTLEIYLDNETTDLNSFMMDLYLPKGFSIAKDEDGSYMVTFYNQEDGKTYNHAATVGYTDDYYRIVATSLSGATIKDGNDLLMEVTIQAPEGYYQNGENMTIGVKDIEFASQSNTVSPHYLSDTEFSVVGSGGATGVPNVESNLEENSRNVYDLQGRRISNHVSSGIYIVNGKKVLIK